MSSRRQYIDSTYLSAYLSGIQLNTDFATADDLISTAEEYIDSYVGPQTKWFQTTSSGSNGVYTAPDANPNVPMLRETRGRVASIVSEQTFTLMAYQQNVFQQDYFALCNMEIIGGTGIGQINHVTGSLYNGQITVELPWTTPLDTTSIYRIYQLGKFPRVQDVFFDSIDVPPRYYKSIPDGVRRATAAQAVYINEKGRAFFNSDASSMGSEHLGSYSYSRHFDKTGTTRGLLIAPEAKEALHGIVKRTGRVNVGP